jgi:FkbM family methyltransferase
MSHEYFGVANPFALDNEQLLAEYESLVDVLSSLPLRQPGRISVLGWDIEYVSGPAVLTNVQYQILKRINDFYPDNDHPTILDLGANIGLSVLNYKRHFTGAKITAFEPDPVFLPVLRNNLNRNGASDVKVIDAAAWTSDGEASWFSEGIDGSKIISNHSEVKQSGLVKTVDLRNFLDQEIDLVKMDIEGAEFAVIPHLAGRLASVKNFSIECHLNHDTVNAFCNLVETLVKEGFFLSINSYSEWRDLIRFSTPEPDHYLQYLLVSAWRRHPPTQLPEWGFSPNANINLPMEITRLRSALNHLNSQYQEIQETLAKSNAQYVESQNYIKELDQQYQDSNRLNEENSKLFQELTLKAQGLTQKNEEFFNQNQVLMRQNEENTELIQALTLQLDEKSEIIQEMNCKNEENLRLIQELQQPIYKRFFQKMLQKVKRAK